LIKFIEDQKMQSKQVKKVKPQKTVEKSPKASTPKQTKQKAPKQPKKKSDMEIEEEKLDIDQDVLEKEEMEEEQNSGINFEALAALTKTSETKQKKKEKIKKVWDFKFRSLELIQIFLKKTKNPTVFLKYVAPLVISIRESQKDKAKDELVNKISALLKSYMNRQQSFGLTYSAELEECVTEILFSARKASTKKVQGILKYLLRCILAIVFKADLKKPVEGLTERYKEALEAYITKKSVELDADYFKELVSKYKVIGVELVELLIQGANFKSAGGAKGDLRREECLNLLTSLVQSSSANSEYLITKLIQHQKKIGELMTNVLENIEEAKNKAFPSLQKYVNLFKLIVRMLAQAKSQEGDEVLKQKAGALVEPFKKQIVKKLKGVQEKEFIKTNKKHAEKVEAMIEEIQKIE